MNVTLAYRLRLPGSFVVGEDVLLELELENAGPAPVRVPDPEANASVQPTYALSGPGAGDVATASLASRVHGPLARAPAAGAPAVELPPGGRWAGRIRLSTLFPLARPGRYTLASELAWDGGRTAAQPVAFELEALEAVEADLAVTGSRDRPEIWAAWLHRGAQGGALFQAGFTERRPDLAQIHRHAVARLARTPAGATDPRTPSSLRSRFDDLFGLAAWREGSVLVAAPSTGGPAARLDMPGPPALVLRPAWRADGRRVEVLVAGKDAAGRASLSLARFEEPRVGAPLVASWVWSTPLPAPAQAGVVAVEPASGARHAILAATVAGRAEVWHGIFAGDAAPQALARAPLDGVALAAGGRPGALADATGRLVAGVLAVSAKDPAEHRLVEVTFGPSGERRTSMGDAFRVEGGVVAGRVGYAGDADGTFRRDWAVLGRDGAVRAPAPGGCRIARQACRWPGAFEILVLLGNTYLLEDVPAGGLGLEVL